MNLVGKISPVKATEIKEDEYVSGQVGNIGEAIGSSIKFGLASSGNFTNKVQFYGLKTLESMGLEIDPQTFKDVEERIDYTSEVGKEIRKQQSDYLSGDKAGFSGVVRDLGVGAVSGISQMAFNYPELATNMVIGAVTSGVGGAVFKGAGTVAKIGGRIVGETLENVAWDYSEKEYFLNEKYTEQDFANNFMGAVAMGTITGGAKFMANRILNDNISIKQIVSPEIEITDGTGKVVSSKKVLDTVKGNSVAKSIATGIETDLDKIDNVKLFNGMEEPKVSELKNKWELNLQLFADLEKRTKELELIKDPKKRLKEAKKIARERKNIKKVDITPDEKIAIEMYNKGDFDIDEVKISNILDEEMKPEIKAQKIVGVEVEKGADFDNKIISDTNEVDTQIKSFLEQEEAYGKKLKELENISDPVEKNKKLNEILDERSKQRETSKKIETPEPEVKVKKEKAEIHTYGANRVAESRLISSIKETGKAIKSIEGGKLTKKTSRAILNDNILLPYQNIKKEVRGLLYGKLQSLSGNSYDDFVTTIKKVNDNGVRMSDILFSDDISGLNIPTELLDSVSAFKNSLDLMFENFSRYNKKFNKKTAMISSRFSRRAFFDRYGEGINFKYSNGNVDLKNLTPADITKLKDNFKKSNVHLFNGNSVHEKFTNAGGFIAELIEDVTQGGLRGKGSNKGRNTAFHRFSMFDKYADESMITLDNLNKIINGSTFKEDKMFIAKLIDDLADTKALNDTFGGRLKNFVSEEIGADGKVIPRGAYVRKLFKENFGNQFSDDYNVAIDGYINFFRKEMGLEIEVDSKAIKMLDGLQSVHYQGIKPLMALKQLPETIVSSWHKTVQWENSALSFPKVLFNDLKNVRTAKQYLASEFYKGMVVNGSELIDDIMKQVELMEIRDTSKGMFIAKTIYNKVSDFNDTISLMKPFEDFFDRSAYKYSMDKTKYWLGLGYDNITKKHTIKELLDLVGLDKQEFDFLSKNLDGLEYVDHYTAQSKLTGLDFSEFKKKYNLTDNEVAKLFTQKLRAMQEAIAETGKSTKADILDIVEGKTEMTQLNAKAMMYLRRSALSSIRRLNSMMISNAKYHNTGEVVWTQAFKNIATLSLATPFLYYANSVSNVTRKVLTSDKDIDTIMEEEFNWLEDEYGDFDPLVFAKTTGKGLAEAVFLNPIINSGFTGQLVENLYRGNDKAVARQLTPQQVKFIQNRILEEN